MSTCKIKIYNPNPYEVSIKMGDAPNKSPNSSTSLKSGKTQEFNVSKGRWIFYDKTTKNRTSPCLGQVQFDNQFFTIPPVGD